MKKLRKWERKNNMGNSGEDETRRRALAVTRHSEGESKLGENEKNGSKGRPGNV